MNQIVKQEMVNRDVVNRLFVYLTKVFPRFLHGSSPEGLEEAKEVWTATLRTYSQAAVFAAAKEGIHRFKYAPGLNDFVQLLDELNRKPHGGDQGSPMCETCRGHWRSQHHHDICVSKTKPLPIYKQKSVDEMRADFRAAAEKLSDQMIVNR